MGAATVSEMKQQMELEAIREAVVWPSPLCVCSVFGCLLAFASLHTSSQRLSPTVGGDGWNVAIAGLPPCRTRQGSDSS
jgi:hypothetical protein